MLKPARWNGFVIYQGATFDETLTWRDAPVAPATTGRQVDLTGYTGRMQVRSAVASADVLQELTTENGGLVLGGVNGTIQFFLNAATTAAITWTQGVYDLELADGDVATRLLFGKIKVSPEVTR